MAALNFSEFSPLRDVIISDVKDSRIERKLQAPPCGEGVTGRVSQPITSVRTRFSRSWILVPAILAPAYIGGRTAAEHWDLTEQIFKDIVVITGQTIRERHQKRQGFEFTLKHLKPEKIFGTKLVWRHKTKVPVSDVHRTVIDVLNDPALGGGIQHVSDCLNVYLKRPDRNDQKLIVYGDQLVGNGAVFKRLGFLAERHGDSATLVELCHARLTAGNAKLDPALDCKRLISRWRLIVPSSWVSGATG